MLNLNLNRMTGFAAVAAGMCAAAIAQQVVEVRTIYVERPPRTVVLVGDVATDVIQLYRDANFQDEFVTLNVMGGSSAGQSHELPAGMEDSLSSLRWNLPAGTLVVFYEDDGAKGEQLALWGSGQIDNLSTFDFDNKASQWAWYYVGGAVEPTEAVRRGQSLPVGAMAGTAPAPQNSMTLFKSKNFEANTATISSVTSQSANTLHTLPQDLPDSLTSMRWNLPPGVVVMFYQDADGTKQQVPIWGSGQVADLDVWDFNDKASRWAWYYIGSPDVEVLGYVPPAEGTVVVDRDSIELVARAMKPNELKIEANDLVAKKNPAGEGTFVYVPKTRFDGVERHAVWIVLDSKAYAITGPAKLVTPALPTPENAPEATWSTSGMSRMNAEADSVKIVFPRK